MKIRIVDGRHVPNPEDLAMVQALHSRSAAPAEEHLAKVAASGSGRFCDDYVVGYNHKSIADCGDTCIFFGGVSLLAAKAIQDHPLYSGQETSTRYIDMGKQPIIDPVDTIKGGGGFSSEGRGILDGWMAFYRKNQDRVAATVREHHPRRPTEDAKKYEGAVKARAFDILRGFLPAGITTQLSWKTNLRQAGDHLIHLIHHPSAELRAIGVALRRELCANYPHSGFEQSLPSVSGVDSRDGVANAARDVWESQTTKDWAYWDGPTGPLAPFQTTIPGLHEALHGILKSRPRGCVLPHAMSALGQVQFAFQLDFGSFRDIQRHRNGVCLMPLLTTENGFEPWYLDQLDKDLEIEAAELIDAQTVAIRRLTKDPVIRQYYTALGFRVPCQITYGLPAAVYVMDMRSSKTVHPTLRKVVLEVMVKNFRAKFPEVALHVDEDPDDWTVRRGGQTIQAKQPAGPSVEGARGPVGPS